MKIKLLPILLIMLIIFNAFALGRLQQRNEVINEQNDLLRRQINQYAETINKQNELLASAECE